MKKKIKIGLLIILLFVVLFFVLAIFFDEAVLVRQDTFYHAKVPQKVVALTFDDGPSAQWTPKILDELSKAGVKATFFMVGEHVQKHPAIAKRVAEEGHEIGNHTFNHPILIFSSTSELEKQILSAESVIKNATGKTTVLFRPPKAWLTLEGKKKIKALGYDIVLWTLNSKDWVSFDDKYMVRYLIHHIHSGDIILFHDSGGVFGLKDGNRSETVKTLPRLIKELKERGYQFVTVSQLLAMDKK